MEELVSAAVAAGVSTIAVTEHYLMAATFDPDRYLSMPAERMGAVSYTHLDVYKRQVLRALARQSTPRQQGVDRGFTERASVLSHGRSAGTLVLANRKGGFDNLSERPSSRLSCEPPLSLTLSNLRRAVSMRTFPLLLCAHCIASLGSPQPKGGFFTPALRLPSTSTRPRRASPASRRRPMGRPRRRRGPACRRASSR